MSLKEVCDNKLDDDGDGLIDSLRMLNPDNNLVESFGSGSPWPIRDRVKTFININNNGAFARNIGGGWSDMPISSVHPTVKKLCNLFGYREILNVGCLETSSNRCNYNSPENDCLNYWDGSKFVCLTGHLAGGSNKYNNAFISTLSCINKLPACSDGIDNDNDGFIDMMDSGCANKNDDSELAHDPDCPIIGFCATNSDCDDKDPKSKDECINPGTEKSYCSNSIVSCNSNSDCGQDGYTGVKTCFNNQVFAEFRFYNCINPGTVKSSCSKEIVQEKIEDCSFGCSEGICKKSTCSDNLDNDNDNLVDRHDPDCWNDPKDHASYNPSLQENGKYLIRCSKDQECNDNNSTTVDICIFQNTGLSYCENRPQNSACSSNIECDDFNNQTFDECIFPGTTSSYCKFSNITCFKDLDCGKDSEIGSAYCDNSNLVIDQKTFRCIYPSTKNSYCADTISKKFLNECIFGCINNQCRSQDNTPPLITLISPVNNYHSFLRSVEFIFNVSDESGLKGCSLVINDSSSGSIVANRTDSNISSSNTFIHNFASNGIFNWIVTCIDIFNNIGSSPIHLLRVDSTESFCRYNYECRPSTSETVCIDGDVVERSVFNECIDGSCIETITVDIVEECEFGCRNSRCQSKDTGSVVDSEKYSKESKVLTSTKKYQATVQDSSSQLTWFDSDQSNILLENNKESEDSLQGPMFVPDKWMYAGILLVLIIVLLVTIIVVVFIRIIRK